MMTALLVVIGGLFVVGAAGVLTGRPWLTRCLLMAPVLAALLLSFGLVVAAPHAPMGSYGQVWVSLNALKFRLDQIPPVHLGGGVATDDVVLSPGLGVNVRRLGRGPLPAGFVTFTAQGKDAVRITLNRQSGPANRAVVLLEPDGEGARYLGAAPAPPALEPCLADCSGPEPQWAKVRKGDVFASRFTPLLGGDGLAPALVFAPARSTDLMVAEGDMSQAQASYVLPRTRTAELTVYEATPSSPQRMALKGEPGRLIPRRAFKVAYDGTQLTLTPRSPETDTLDLSDEASRVVRIVSGEAAAAAVGDETFVVFTLMGQSFDAELEQDSLDVARDSSQPSVLHRVDGSQEAIDGAREVGTDRSVVIAVRPLDLKSGLGRWLALFGVVALLASVSASLRLRLSDPLAALAFAALDVLLTLRLLVAVEGSFVDSAAKAQAAVPAAIIALPMGAFLALAAHPCAWSQRSGLAALAAITLAAIGLGWAGGGSAVELTILAPLLLAAGGALAFWRAPQTLLAAYDRKAKAWVAVALFGSLFILVTRTGLALAFHWREAANLGFTRLALSLIFVPLTLAISAPLLAHVAAGWDGGVERPLWLFRQPFLGRLARAGEAAGQTFGRWRWLARRPWQAMIAALTLAAILVVGVALPSAQVKDNGFFVFMLPIAVGAAAAYLARPVAGRLTDLALATLTVLPALGALLFWVLGFSWVACLIVALLSLVVGGATYLVRPGAAWLTPLAAIVGLLLLVNAVAAAGERPSTLMSLDQALKAKTNDMRLFAVLGPERLAEMGTQGAEGLQDTNDHMRVYSATFRGRGYFNLPPPTVLRLYHESDNVSAVHLISPFGRLGALGFILVPGALAAATLSMAMDRRKASDWLGALAALTLALVSAYMILANLLAAPFTGRNVYLLAAASTADLLEGLALTMLVVAALGSKKIAGEP